MARDIVAGTALLAIGVGCWWLHPAVALIVIGGLLLIGIIQPWKRM